MKVRIFKMIYKFLNLLKSINWSLQIFYL